MKPPKSAAQLQVRTRTPRQRTTALAPLPIHPHAVSTHVSLPDPHRCTNTKVTVLAQELVKSYQPCPVRLAEQNQPEPTADRKTHQYFSVLCSNGSHQTKRPGFSLITLELNISPLLSQSDPTHWHQHLAFFFSYYSYQGSRSNNIRTVSLVVQIERFITQTTSGLSTNENVVFPWLEQASGLHQAKLKADGSPGQQCPKPTSTSKSRTRWPQSSELQQHGVCQARRVFTAPRQQDMAVRSAQRDMNSCLYGENALRLRSSRGNAMSAFT